MHLKWVHLKSRRKWHNSPAPLSFFGDCSFHLLKNDCWRHLVRQNRSPVCLQAVRSNLGCTVVLHLLCSTKLAVLSIKQLQWSDQLLLHKLVLSVIQICVTVKFNTVNIFQFIPLQIKQKFPDIFTWLLPHRLNIAPCFRGGWQTWKPKCISWIASRLPKKDWES